jgi:hypothetical protein
VTQELRAPPAPARTFGSFLLTTAVYIAASLLLFHRVLGSLSTATTGWASSDSHLFLWWLEWVPWSVLHGQSPLLTQHQHFPIGVNAMWNTTTPVLGALLAPLTLSAGPVLAYNVGMVLGPVASGLALVFGLRPYVARWAPRAAAGFLYGFGPFVIAHASVGHLNLVWAVLPPILLRAVHPIFVRPRRPLLAGAGLGLALAVQTLLYTQTVALGVVALVLTAAVLALRRPRLILRRAGPVLVAASTCLVLYAILCAYPIALLVAGPARPLAVIRDPDDAGADAANLLLATGLTRFRWQLDGLAPLLHDYTGEQGGYLGLTMLVLLVVIVIVVRRPAVRVVGFVGLLMAVLSLGTHLIVLGADLGVRLPWQWLLGVPLLDQVEPVRFQVFVALCVAALVAMWLDHLAEHLAELGPAVALAAAGTIAAVATWVPADAQDLVPADVPEFFRTAAPGLAPYDVVATFPRTSGTWRGGAEPLLWQATSGMAYRSTGGYFIASDPTHPLLLETPQNRYDTTAAAVASGAPALPPTAAADALHDLRAVGATAVVVVDEPGTGAPAVADWTRQVTGTDGVRSGGVWLFHLS